MVKRHEKAAKDMTFFTRVIIGVFPAKQYISLGQKNFNSSQPNKITIVPLD